MEIKDKTKINTRKKHKLKHAGDTQKQPKCSLLFAQNIHAQ